MRIEYVVISDFRGIGRFRLADTQDTRPIVFIGENGVGKSSIIEAINIALSHFTSRMRNPKASGKQIHEIDIRHGKPWCEISTSVLMRRGYGGRHDFNWSVVKYRRGQERDPGSSLVMLRQQVQDMHENLRQPGINLPIVAYYPTNRRIVEVSVRPGADEASDPVDAYDASTHGSTVDFQLLFQWFREREDAENRTRLRDNPAYRDRALEAVRNSVIEFFPGYTELHVDQRGQSLELIKVEGTTWIDLPFTQLSDGEKCGAALVADIARRLAIANPGLSNPLEGDGIVLIDEIELHLHPRWQRLMVPGLTKNFPNCQFIISTHSPQVLSEIQSAYVYLLQAERDTDQGVKATVLDSLYGRDSNRLLEDIMGDHERPKEVQDALLEIFRTIDRGDLEGARKRREELIQSGLYAVEPVFAKADVLMRKKETRPLRYIQKGQEPAVITEWKAMANQDWQPSWEVLQKPQKTVLHEALVEEQRFVCCYCETRIDVYGSHIEHYRPQSKRRDLELEYPNLFASCGRPEHGRSMPERCGVKKGDWYEETVEDIIASPLRADCETLFRYTGVGEIQPTLVPSLAEKARRTINELGLDIPLLREERGVAIDGLLESVDSLTHEDLRRLHDGFLQADDAGRYEPFATTLTHIIREYLLVDSGERPI